MASRYKAELGRLNDAYRAAAIADIDDYCRVVEGWRDSPMVMIGSGGSFSTASFLAHLHEIAFGQPAKASTPLELTHGGQTSGGVACFSASGRNRDIAVAFKSAAQRELVPLSAVVMTKESPLHSLGLRYRYADIVSFSSESFNDGFLAVASLLASAVLATRVFLKVSGEQLQLPSSVTELMDESTKAWDEGALVEQAAQILNGRTASVLYTNALRPASVDLESRFVEAGLGNLHIADLRNFGHGRHFWMHKHQLSTAIIALIGDGMEGLADRTLSALPEEIPKLRIDFKGPAIQQSLAGLVAGLFLSLGAGIAADVDPAKPGVPEFGRKLYRIGPPSLRAGQKDLNLAAAIRRKGIGKLSVEATSEWAIAYEGAFNKATGTSISGLVLDYDGTLCDDRTRFEIGLDAEIANELVRLLEIGLPIGIATGRGPSAGASLRRSIPQEIWDRVLVGYYNAAIIVPLFNIADPLAGVLSSDDELLCLLSHHELFSGGRIRANMHQISVNLTSRTEVLRVYPALERIVHSTRPNARIVVSSHSVDILLSGQTKQHVVNEVARVAGSSPDQVLRIGDKGMYPGNDAELLEHTLGLSVEESNGSKTTGWAFAPAGIRGVQATRYYLKGLKCRAPGAKLEISMSDRG